VEEGEGEPLVFLHGNAGMIQDFASSGLLSRAAARYRVIVFDRPGFGYSVAILSGPSLPFIGDRQPEQSGRNILRLESRR
jgi:pimeloyl-ACP methyl ester carboxylesterase